MIRVIDSTMVRFAPVPRGDLASNTFQYVPHWSAKCEHQKLAGRWCRTTSGLLRAKQQCLTCGRGVGQFLPTASGQEYGIWDHKLEEEIEHQRKAHDLHMRESREKTFSAVNAQWWRVYESYLSSAVWQSKRQAVFKRSNGVCECCGINAAKQVHHVKYPKDFFGLEPLWDLRAVCVDCHCVIHPHMDG
jgi:hypothetical protein